MKYRAPILRVYFAVAMLAPIVAGAAEPVVVYTRPPAEIAEQENLETVLRDLPAHTLKWAAFKQSTLSYIVKQKFAGLLVPDPCEGLPIQVKIVRGQLQSAVYVKSGGRCKAGNSAGPTGPSQERLYLTPEDFFWRVAQAEEQLSCYKKPLGCMPTSLYVTYDEKLGIPIKLEDYSQSVSDHYWSLEVSNLQLQP
jgi:hypothetical protein